MMADAEPPVVAVLGASGLIGFSLAHGLALAGAQVIPVARYFTGAQKAALEGRTVEMSIADLSGTDLHDFLEQHEVEIVINCIGLLQDEGGKGLGDVHEGFARRLCDAVSAKVGGALLIQISIPGRAEDDLTGFARTKRAAERVIAGSGAPYILLRPGFVVAPAAYGGSALIRALAAWPMDLPAAEAGADFAATDIADIVATVAHVAGRWEGGERNWRASWDLMEGSAGTVGSVVTAFRRRLGADATRRRTLPRWMLAVGCSAGDFAARLGWRPPVRSAALAELRRGVSGNPQPWIEATGIEPATLPQMLLRYPLTVQDNWFSRLYLLKGAIVALLAIFWLVSGAIPLLTRFAEASALLLAGAAWMPVWLAAAITLVTSLADIAIGLAIAIRRWSRVGLMAGIGLGLVYLVMATVLTPWLWLDPVGSLVKTMPSLLLMVVALALSDSR